MFITIPCFFLDWCLQNRLTSTQRTNVSWIDQKGSQTTSCATRRCWFITSNWVSAHPDASSFRKMIVTITIREDQPLLKPSFSKHVCFYQCPSDCWSFSTRRNRFLLWQLKPMRFYLTKFYSLSATFLSASATQTDNEPVIRQLQDRSSIFFSRKISPSRHFLQISRRNITWQQVYLPLTPTTPNWRLFSFVCPYMETNSDRKKMRFMHHRA